MVMVGCRSFTETRMDSKSIKTGTTKINLIPGMRQEIINSRWFEAKLGNMRENVACWP